MRRPSPPVLAGLSFSSRLRIFAALCVTIGMAFGATRLMAQDNAWVHKGDIDGLVNSDDAEQYSESRCGLAAGVVLGTSPGWVRVGGSADPHAPIVEASGQILDPKDYVDFNIDDDIHRDSKTNAFVNYTDNQLNHFARDLNIFLTLDPEDRHLLSTGSFAEGDSNEHGNLEVEWERGGIPMYAFPAIGDRLHVWGTHIFDCGHGDTWVDGVDDPDEYRTEIHSPFGWVIYRQTADADGRPQAGKENQSPWVWYESTDLQGMAVTLPTSGLLHTPVQATVADMYFSTYGGNSVESVNGCDDFDNSDGAVCHDYTNRPELSGNEDIDSWEWANPILDQDYSFVVPAPPIPAGAPADVEMIFEFEDRCAEVPANPTYPNKNDHKEAQDGVEDIGATAYFSDRPIGSATCNPTPDNKLPYTIEVDRSTGHPFASWNHTNRPAIRFTLRAKTGQDGIDGNADDPTYPANDYLSFAYRVKVAWDYAPSAANRARNFRADFDTLHVYHDGDFCDDNANIDYDDGEWIMTLRVADQTIHPVEGTAPDDIDIEDVTIDEPFWEEGVIDDERCGGNEGTPRNYEMGSKGAQYLTRFFTALPGRKIEVWDRTYDKDHGSGDDLGPAYRQFYDQPAPGGSENYVIGSETELFQVAHTIDFKITDVSNPIPAIGTISIGTPQYGPNADTSGRIRVNGTTPITIDVPPEATGIEYRIWPLAIFAEPGAWQFDYDDSDGFTIDLPNTGASVYFIEWATISGSGETLTVSERTRTEVELDNVPPALTVPNDFSVYANSAAGANTTYSTSAPDNLPGPVIVECLPPSGSIFPNGANAPQTTTVNCTATDAVTNSAADAFDVTVTSPHGYINDYALMGIDWLDAGQGGSTIGGGVGVFQASAGISGQPNIELRLGNDSTVTPAANVAAHSVKIGNGVKVGDLFSVTQPIVGSGTVYTLRSACGAGPASGVECAYVPLWPSLPAFAAPPAPGPPVVNQQINANASLGSGSYGALVLKSKVVLTLTGEQYYFTRIELGPNSKIQYSSPNTVVRVAGRVEFKSGVGVIQPSGGGQPHLRLYVAGADEAANKPAVDMFAGSTIAANVYVQNGTMAVGNKSILTGAFIAKRLQLGSNVTVTKNSVFVQ